MATINTLIINRKLRFYVTVSFFWVIRLETSLSRARFWLAVCIRSNNSLSKILGNVTYIQGRQIKHEILK